MTGAEMYAFAGELYPLPRSLTGYYVRKTLNLIAERLPLKRHSVPSGSEIYDWTVPPEWEVSEAWLDGPDGRVCSWDDNPLHLMFYSQPTDTKLSLADLREHLYTSPHGIPYTTSYYADNWGFNLSQEAADALPDGEYRAHIDTRFHDGQLDYADLIIPGETSEEVLFSTYVCHPNMADDNVSGMVVQTALAEWVASEPRRYTYRFVFCPETIGALAYMAGSEPARVDATTWRGRVLLDGSSRSRLGHMQQNVVAGFVLNCLGDDRTYSMVESRTGETYADKMAATILRSVAPITDKPSPPVTTFPRRWTRRYGWMDRGSDERQYASPRADLPVVNLARSRWGTFPEYHTSADDLSVISPGGLSGSLDMLKRLVRILEGNGRFRARFVGDAQLGDRGLYPTVGHGKRRKEYQHVLSYCDGTLDAIDIADRTGMGVGQVIDALETLRGHELVEAA